MELRKQRNHDAGNPLISRHLLGSTTRWNHQRIHPLSGYSDGIILKRGFLDTGGYLTGDSPLVTVTS